jgi:hypothetical protein
MTQKLKIFGLTLIVLVIAYQIGSPDEILAQNQQVDSFCSSLQAMIRAGANSFRSLRGSRDPYSSGTGWASRISLPGATECEVWNVEDSPGISCDFSKSASADHLDAQYDEIVEKLEACLKGWKETQATKSGHVIKGTHFDQADITVRIEIVERPSHRNPGFDLTLWIDKNAD